MAWLKELHEPNWEALLDPQNRGSPPLQWGCNSICCVRKLAYTSHWKERIIILFCGWKPHAAKLIKLLRIVQRWKMAHVLCWSSHNILPLLLGLITAIMWEPAEMISYSGSSALHPEHAGAIPTYWSSTLHWESTHPCPLLTYYMYILPFLQGSQGGA